MSTSVAWSIYQPVLDLPFRTASVVSGDNVAGIGVGAKAKGLLDNIFCLSLPWLPYLVVVSTPNFSCLLELRAATMNGFDKLH